MVMEQLATRMIMKLNWDLFNNCIMIQYMDPIGESQGRFTKDRSLSLTKFAVFC